MTARSGSAVLAGVRSLTALPGWLLAAADGEVVMEELARAVPELPRNGSRSCVVRRIRLKDEQRWHVEYEAAFDGPGGQRRDVGLVGWLNPPASSASAPAGGAGSIGSAGWWCSLPGLGLSLRTRGEDAELEAVPLLTDPRSARALLEHAIRASAGPYSTLRIAGCAPRVVRYKRGSRCTVVYHLSYPPQSAAPGWPKLVVAKTYREEKGRNAYEAMRALWDSPLRHNGVVDIAEPLAYLQRERVLVQGPVDEELTLKQLIRGTLAEGRATTSDRLARALRQTGAGLAALHGSGVRYGAAVTLDDELAEVRERTERIANVVPAVGAAVGPLLALVEERAGASPAGPLVPSHRSFRPAQVLLAGDRIAFIDFDGFCQAEPALDVALFRTTMTSIGISALVAGDSATRRNRLRETDMLCDAFTDAYRASAPVSDERVALWETLNLLTNVLNCWVKAKAYRLDGARLALETHVARLLAA